MRLALCVPSRGRPRVLANFVESFLSRRTGCSTLIIRNGEKDTADYSAFDDLGPDVIRVVGPDDGFNTTWVGTAGYAPAQQDIYERFPDFDAYLCIEDDTIIETRGFDERLLKGFDRFPNRVGMIELFDRTQTIHVQCFSKEWIAAVGHLCIPAVGELAHEVSIALAPCWVDMDTQFTHYPCVRAFGYTGNERAGAVETNNADLRNRYYQQRAWVFNEWLPQHGPRLRQQIARARE